MLKILLHLVPGEPRNVDVRKINSSTLEVSWDPPADDNKNGVIRGYQIYVQPKNVTVSSLFNERNEGTLAILALHYFT